MDDISGNVTTQSWFPRLQPTKEEYAAASHYLEHLLAGRSTVVLYLFFLLELLLIALLIFALIPMLICLFFGIIWILRETMDRTELPLWPL